MEPEPGTEQRERPLAGLGRFAWLVGVGTVLALAIAAAGLWAAGPRGGPPDERPPAGRVTREPAGGGESSSRPSLPAGSAARPVDRPAAAQPEPDPEPVGAVAREVERRHAAGELAEAQRRFDPCPGGDVRRVAWIERDQRVVKLARHRADGLLVEEWFDGEGRLREALVRGRRAGGGRWARHLSVDEAGREVEVGGGQGLASEEPPPALVRSDPGGAFFAGPGCAPGPR